jgi:hypothetical protein
VTARSPRELPDRPPAPGGETSPRSTSLEAALEYVTIDEMLKLSGEFRGGTTAPHGAGNALSPASH